ncbi:MAG: hypothetical protein ACTHZD_14715 [Micrococcaceae bacterium]
MLDGLSDLSGLSQITLVARYFLGSALLILVAGGSIGAVMWIAGKTQSSQQTSTRGLKTLGVSLLGAVVLGSVGGVIQFSTTMGTSELMPEAAQPREIIIEREAALTSCTDRVTKTWGATEGVTPDEREDALYQIAGDAAFNEFDLGSRDGLTGIPGFGAGVIQSISWYPQGNDCSANNLRAAAGTEVSIVVQGSGSQTVEVSRSRGAS